MNEFDECIRRKQLREETPSPEKAEKSISESKEWLNEVKKSNRSGARRAAFISIYLAYFHLQELYYSMMVSVRRVITVLEYIFRSLQTKRKWMQNGL